MKPESKLYTVNALSRITGADPKTINKVIAKLGIEPSGKQRGCNVYPLEPIQAGLSTKPDKTLREEKLAEEIRKLRIVNDEREGKLIARTEVNAAVGQSMGAICRMLDQKLENEFPALCVGLDLVGIRTKGKQLNDSIRAELRKLCETWPE